MWSKYKPVIGNDNEVVSTAGDDLLLSQTAAVRQGGEVGMIRREKPGGDPAEAQGTRLTLHLWSVSDPRPLHPRRQLPRRAATRQTNDLNNHQPTQVQLYQTPLIPLGACPGPTVWGRAAGSAAEPAGGRAARSRNQTEGQRNAAMQLTSVQKTKFNFLSYFRPCHVCAYQLLNYWHLIHEAHDQWSEIMYLNHKKKKSPKK